MAEPWTCPYCNRDCTIDGTDIRVIQGAVEVSKEYGTYNGRITITVCPNPRCRQRMISAKVNQVDARGLVGEELFSWKLIPESEARPFPHYIPKPMRDDYVEACLIKNKSPKASATLSRRCLQGIIRDYWQIRKQRLVDEIEALKEKVDSTTWEAIDSVRRVGNIGAHMEHDVNLIVDVEPYEASMLIQVIETLFTEWYITRYEREQRMKAVTQMAAAKVAAKPTSPSQPPA